MCRVLDSGIGHQGSENIFLADDAGFHYVACFDHDGLLVKANGSKINDKIHYTGIINSQQAQKKNGKKIDFSVIGVNFLLR
jgi:hypothetical protein